MTTTPEQNLAAAVAYYRAFERKDPEEIRRHLHPDVRFSGPLATLEGREPVVEAAKRLSAMLRGITFRGQCRAAALLRPAAVRASDGQGRRVLALSEAGDATAAGEVSGGAAHLARRRPRRRNTLRHGKHSRRRPSGYRRESVMLGSSPRGASMLHEFLADHRDAIIERARARVAARRVPLASPAELEQGVPAFLAQLIGLLREEIRLPPTGSVSTTAERAEHAIGDTADREGDALLRAGLSVAQVVEGYGDVCQAITEHAAETKATISVDEYHTLNLCLDVATARAVTAFSGARDRRTSTQETERLGVLAHEMRNLLSSAMLAYQALKSGGVGIDGSTGAVLGRSLRGMRDIVDRSLAQVRLAATLQNPERVELAQFIEEIEVTAALDAKTKGLALNVPPVEHGLAVHVDRPLLASAVANLVQNAIKFTPAGHRVSLTGHRDSTQILIEVEDECGGLAEGHAETMFRPFERRGTNASGLGLGLKISHDAVTANGGQIRVRNLPGKGCVFTIALPPAV